MTDPPQNSESEGSSVYYRVCSTCRTPLAFGARYYRCSVSTCNRQRTGLYFCSLACWDAHLPEARHRDAWAEETLAPSREALEAERVTSEAAIQRQPSPVVRQAPPGQKLVASATAAQAPREVLVVISKLKTYIRARSEMNTSDAVAEVLSDTLRRLCDRAIESARLEGRKTVLDRDFKASLPRDP